MALDSPLALDSHLGFYDITSPKHTVTLTTDQSSHSLARLAASSTLQLLTNLCLKTIVAICLAPVVRSRLRRRVCRMANACIRPYQLVLLVLSCWLHVDQSNIHQKVLCGMCRLPSSSSWWQESCGAVQWLWPARMHIASISS